MFWTVNWANSARAARREILPDTRLWRMRNNRAWPTLPRHVVNSGAQGAICAPCFWACGWNYAKAHRYCAAFVASRCQPAAPFRTWFINRCKDPCTAVIFNEEIKITSIKRWILTIRAPVRGAQSYGHGQVMGRSFDRLRNCGARMCSILNVFLRSMPEQAGQCIKIIRLAN